MARPPFPKNMPEFQRQFGRRGGLSGLPGRVSLARRVRVSSLRTPARLSLDRAAPMAMRHLPLPGLADSGHDSPQHEDALDGVVLGGLSGRHRQTWYFGLPAPTAVGLRRYETAWMLLHNLRRAMV